MNWILMREEYPKLFIPKEYTQQYYESIDLHNEKKYKEYYNKMFEIMIKQINIVHKK